jgi:hypothetical protein
MATCSAGLVWQTVAFLHQIEAALAGCAWQSLQNTPETRQETVIRRAEYRCGYLSFNFEEKKMKNVLLATTAIALTAGYAAAENELLQASHMSYDANDIGGLVDTGADGEDDDAGDWMLSYAGNGMSASYEVDEDSNGWSL